MATTDVVLTPLTGDPRPLDEWLTTFRLLPVFLDPYTHESAWILDTSRRILGNYAGASCRPCWILHCDIDDARRFLGPYGDEFLSFADPAGAAARAAGIERLPALAFIRQDGEVLAKAEGWQPDEWRAVVETVSDLTKWIRPTVPAVGDPAPFTGTPVGA